MNTPEKLRMAHALEALGVDIIEAGFAIASPGDFAAISSICQEIRGPRIASLARARSEDIGRGRALWKGQTGRAFTSSSPAQTFTWSTS